MHNQTERENETKKGESTKAICQQILKKIWNALKIGYSNILKRTLKQ